MCVDHRNLKVSKNLFSPWQKFKKHNIEESSKYDMFSLKRFQRFFEVHFWWPQLFEHLRSLCFHWINESFKETLVFLIYLGLISNILGSFSVKI